MTYMSIPMGLAPLVQARRLFCLPSAVTGFETQRTVYASRMVVDAVSGPFASNGFDDHFIEFRAHLDAFLEGAFFTVADRPHDKPPETMLARVHPVEAEIWDFRSVAPHPGIRCLGAFWEQDAFVALRWDFERTSIGMPRSHDAERIGPRFSARATR